ncbi:MAG: Sialic acid-specific 9-O-acetylesterase [Verrucomicrobiales bacterium]|nr:Sialic acid-specific 9-O-acetylesterase [Verrucomicrobiales bacterium]
MKPIRPFSREFLSLYPALLASLLVFNGCQTSDTTAAKSNETSAAANQGAVSLPNVFSHNMVLQMGTSTPIWGWGTDGDTVTVIFRGQKKTAKVKGGEWQVHFNNLKPGGPDDLTVSSQNTVTYTNVLVGEVWIASGQSNMELALRDSFEAAKDIASSENNQIRLLTVPKLKLTSPTNNMNGHWELCNPTTVPRFSAVAYYFGRDLQKHRGVPVGLIHTSWGGSPAEVWIREEVMAANPAYKSAILDPMPAKLEKYQKDRAAWEKDSADAKKENKPFTRRAPNMDWRPAELYNGMIAPIVPYGIQGAIWYQGESNAGRAEQYRTLFADMIQNWRHDWHQGDFTFLEVQLAPFMKIKTEPGESTWAELREAQLLATKNLPNVGMAVITDVGEENDIHPKKKQPVGERLSAAARAIAYHENIEFAGPLYKNMKTEGANAILTFSHVGKGLETDGSQLKGFTICGPDHKFVNATATINGDKVVVNSPSVSQPVAVRYGWADYPVVNLWNKDGFPATPFRTDDFPMITAGKK